MKIGDYYSLVANTKIGAAIIKHTGVMEYHTHIRIKPFLNYMKRQRGEIKILEIGCGTGTNLFEAARTVKERERFWAVGVDMNGAAIRTAQNLKKKLQNSNIEFINKDAFEYLESEEIEQFNYILLYDFLEHIKNPDNFLKKLEGLLKGKHIYIVSVPTPNYPKVFGRKFHKEVGHVCDGYTKEMLDDLFKKAGGYKRVFSSYNTGAIGSIGARIYYKWLWNTQSRVWKVLRYFLTIPFRWLDINNEKVSCEVFAIYRKQE